ncbi:hypothetical protein Tco_0014962 [Tanacetum coccineum]
MLAICKADEPVAFKAPKTSSKAEKKDTQDTKPGAKSRRRKKQIPFLYNHPQSKIETAKGVSSTKGDTSSQTGHSVKETQSSLAKDTNQSQPPVSIGVVAGMHKEVQQATSGPTSLGVTSEEGAHPQLSSGMSASIHIKPIYSTSTIIHYESASSDDALVDFTVEVDLSKYAPNDSISKQQGMDKGTQNYSLDNIFAETNPSVLIDKTKSAGDGLKTAHTETCTNLETSKAEKEVSLGDDEFNTSPNLSSSNDAKTKIKLEDLSKLVQNVYIDFMDLDSPKDDEPIIVQDDSDEEVYAEKDQPEEPKET